MADTKMLLPHSSHRSRGFALPTILVASIVMLMVLVSAVAAVSSVRVSLNNQYFNQLASEAAESGVARAKACLAENYYVSTWNSSKLFPNTTCSGGSACTNAANCFVLQTSDMRTTFEVDAPVNSGTSQTIGVTGKVELLRNGGASVWRTYSSVTNARIGTDLSLKTVGFGYSRAGGSFFGSIAADGQVRTVGSNVYGQLGNGTTNLSVTPTNFLLPDGERAVSLFTNFVATGRTLFALTDSGALYGAGVNDVGQLGNGSSTNQSTPVRYNLPAGVQARSVGVTTYATFVVGSDNNVYSSGSCSDGLLGSNYTLSGCSNALTYRRVALPAPNPADLNTIPSTKISIDYYSAYIVMEGGRVYGWGRNMTGQLASGDYIASSNPLKIGNYGDVGQPKAVDIATDGDSIFIVDDNGGIKGSGRNDYGSLGNPTSSIYGFGSNMCVTNPSSSTVNLTTCNSGDPQQFTYRPSDSSLYNIETGRCLTNTGGDGVTVQTWSCQGLATQQWDVTDSSVRNIGANRCLKDSGTSVILANCTTAVADRFYFSTSRLVDFELPGAASGQAIRVSTDQWSTSVLTSTGEVWSAGINNQGQLGDGTIGVNRFSPVKFILPAGVKAIDVYNTSNGTVGAPIYNNIFVIGDDGRVYGAGNNQTGQLGDGTLTSRTTPVPMLVFNGTTVRADEVLSGLGTTIVLSESRQIYTVGNNEHGQLGDGTTNNNSTPRANRYTNVLPVSLY